MFRDDTTSSRPRLIVRGAAAGALLGLVGLASPASAHVTVTPPPPPLAPSRCSRSASATAARARPPPRSPSRCRRRSTPSRPTRNALWEVEKETEQLDPPVADAHGNEITERVASVTYRAETPLPDGYRDTFELSLQLPDAEGDTLVFPTIQTCEQGESAWIEVPQDGQDSEELELPAPSFVISEAGEGDHHATAAAETASDDDHDAAAEEDEDGQRPHHRRPGGRPARSRARRRGARPAAPTDMIAPRPRRIGAAALLFLAVAALVLGLSSPASAHATLVSTDPAEGAVLQAAPEQVR